MYKSEEVVGHVPRKILFLCAAFIRRGGTIYCTVEGNRRYSNDLAQGGMEIPCKLTFKGPLKELQKVQKYFSSALKIQIHITNTSSNSPFISCLLPQLMPLPRGLHNQESVEWILSLHHKKNVSSVVQLMILNLCQAAISLNSSEKSPLPKKDALGGSAVEKEKQVVLMLIAVNQLLP